MRAAAEWLWRRMKAWASSLAISGQTGRGGLSIAAKLDLGAKKSLLVVAYGERRFLVANGAETISAMLEIGAGLVRGGIDARDCLESRASRRTRRMGPRRTRSRAELATAGSRLESRLDARLESSRGGR